MKLNDNELVECWNNSSNRNINSNNSHFEKKYLGLTNKLDIKDGKIVNTREIEKHIYLSLVCKEFTESSCEHKIYSLVMFNMNPSLAPEISRITKYCLFKSRDIDILEDIINFRVKQTIESINIAIDEKFKHIFNYNFKTVKHRFGKELVDIIVKPPRIDDSPSITHIINDMPKIIQEKKNKIEVIEYKINQRERELLDREILLAQKEKRINEKEISLTNNKLNIESTIIPTEGKKDAMVSINRPKTDDYELII